MQERKPLSCVQATARTSPESFHSQNQMIEPFDNHGFLSQSPRHQALVTRRSCVSLRLKEPGYDFIIEFWVRVEGKVITVWNADKFDPLTFQGFQVMQAGAI